MADGNRRYKSDKKLYKVSFKLSEEDKRLLEEGAKKAGMNISEYLRNLVRGGGNVDASFTTDSCLLYTSPSPRDGATSRMPSSA